jgi:hypothetical protein
MESSLSDGYYQRCYATARRVAKLKKDDFASLPPPTMSPADGDIDTPPIDGGG